MGTGIYGIGRGVSAGAKRRITRDWVERFLIGRLTSTMPVTSVTVCHFPSAGLCITLRRLAAMHILKFILLSLAVTGAASIPLRAQSSMQQVQPSTTAGTFGAREKTALDLYRRLPLRFEENRGQTSSQAKFLSRKANSTLFLTSDGAVLTLARNTGAAGPSARRKPAVLRMNWIGANSESPIEGLDELPGKSNYFIGNRPDGWRTGIPVYGKVRYHDLYSGVDLVYYGSDGKLEYDLVLSPSADPGAIRLSIRGASQIRLAQQGDLVLKIEGQDVRLHRPVIYQPSMSE